jgi:hypothetical protein
VAEAGLEGADREPLTVRCGLFEGLDGGALHDQHRDVLEKVGRAYLE